MADTSPPPSALAASLHDYLGDLMFKIVSANSYFTGLCVCLKKKLEMDAAERIGRVPRAPHIVPLFQSTRDLVLHLACAAFVAIFSDDYDSLVSDDEATELPYMMSDIEKAKLSTAYAKLHNAKTEWEFILRTNKLRFRIAPGYRGETSFMTTRGLVPRFSTPYIEAYFINEIIQQNAGTYYQADSGQKYFNTELRKVTAPGGSFPVSQLQELGELAPRGRYDFTYAFATNNAYRRRTIVNCFVAEYYRLSVRDIIDNVHMSTEDKYKNLIRDLMIFLVAGFIASNDNFLLAMARAPAAPVHIGNAASRFL